MALSIVAIKFSPFVKKFQGSGLRPVLVLRSKAAIQRKTKDNQESAWESLESSEIFL